MVWLAIIPFVGFVWIFINVIRIAESLRHEYRDRGLHARGEGIVKLRVAVADDRRRRVRPSPPS